MKEMLNVNLFSQDSIEIKNIKNLSDRHLIKFKIYLQQIHDADVIFGNDSIILSCNEKSVIGEIGEKIIGFLEAMDIDAIVSPDFKAEIDRNRKRKEENNINVDLLRKIKDGDLKNDADFMNYKITCDKLLKITLKDYQYKSSYLLSKAKSGFDFSVPGSGKTIITYATYAFWKNQKEVDNIIIIGPKNAYNAWYEEYNTCFGSFPKFENLSEELIKNARDYLCSSAENHKEVTFINIEKIRNLKKELQKFLSSSKCVLVIDEGHKVKNPNAASTIVAMDLAKFSSHKIILTGTPMPNGYEDLSSLTYIINPYESILPFDYAKLRKFTVKGIKAKEEEAIMDSLYPYYSRVSKKYLINRGELKPPLININFVEMSENQRYVYEFLDGLITNYHNKWELEFESILMRAILIRKMQVSANPKLLRKSIISSFEEFRSDLLYAENGDEISNEMIEEFKRKLAVADEIINRDINNSDVGKIVKKFINDEELVNKNLLSIKLAKELVDRGEKVILWDTFVENMDTLHNMLLKEFDINSGIINGTVTGDSRQGVINNFRYSNLKVLIASPATLAESISLHKCCQNAIYVNRNFNAAQFIQSKDRIHRINMPNGTTANYIFLINKDSIDEGISDRLELKESRMLRILDSDRIRIGFLESQDCSSMSDEDVKATYNL